VYGISSLAKPILQGTVGRLAWRVEDPAIDIEAPAMMAAPNAFFGNEPELE
jgi:hypothetical protein